MSPSSALGRSSPPNDNARTGPNTSTTSIKSEPHGDQPGKRKRPQSCDTCRSRKIKCVRFPMEGSERSPDSRCVQCRAIDARCTFDYVPKRPGPQSSFAKTARREAEATAQAKVQSEEQGQKRPHGSLSAPASAHASSQLHACSGVRQQQSPAGIVAGSVDSSSHPSQHVQQHQQQAISPVDDSWYRVLTQQAFSGGSGGGTQTRSSSWSGGALDSYLNSSMMTLTPQFAGLPATSPFEFSANQTALLGRSSDDIHAASHSIATQSTPVSVATSATPSNFSSLGASPWQPPSRTDSLSRQPHLHRHQHHHQVNPVQLPGFSHPDPVEPLFPTHASSHETRSASLQIPLPSFSRAASPIDIGHGATSSQRDAAQSDAASSMYQAPQDSSSKKRKRETTRPSIARMYTGPILRPRSLDDIAPRQTFLAIVSLYFHYLWPLLPIVDRPTFSHDLLNRRDERDESFLAFVLSLTSYTLIQCPRTVIPPAWSVYRKLHRICHLTSRRMQPRFYDPPLLMHVNTLYCDHIYLGSTGKNNAANAVLGEAIRVAYTLGLHDERRLDSTRGGRPLGLDSSSSLYSHIRPPTVNAVERELRKRMFWVLHGSSTTVAVLQDEPVFIHGGDVCVDLPLAVDEEALVTPTQIQRSPSILCGFLTVTRLHQIMLEALESYRRDRRRPIEDLNVLRSRFSYLGDISRRIAQVIEEAPEDLRRPLFNHAPPQPIRKPGSAVPSLEAVTAPPLQAIGMDPVAQSALGDHLSGASAWPWPVDAFTREGLPNAELRSSFAHPFSNRSPKMMATEANSGAPAEESAQPPHQVLTPPALTPHPVFSALAGGRLSFVDQVNIFRPSPPPTSTPILSPMCTMYANIMVTESLIRFLITEYRELVYSQVQELKLRSAHSHSRNKAMFDFAEESQGEGWESAAANMLRVFNSMPLDALASNGQSLISKIIYVVSSMLNRTAGKTPNGNGFHYMSSLLSTLTKLSQTRKEDGTSFDGEDAGDVNDEDDDDSDDQGGRRGDPGADDIHHFDSDFPHQKDHGPRRDGKDQDNDRHRRDRAHADAGPTHTMAPLSPSCRSTRNQQPPSNYKFDDAMSTSSLSLSLREGAGTLSNPESTTSTAVTSPTSAAPAPDQSFFSHLPAQPQPHSQSASEVQALQEPQHYLQQKYQRHPQQQQQQQSDTTASFFAPLSLLSQSSTHIKDKHSDRCSPLHTANLNNTTTTTSSNASGASSAEPAFKKPKAIGSVA